MTNRPPPAAVFAAPVIMLVIAVAPLPYGYYQLLRLVVACTGIWIAAAAWHLNATAWAIGVTLIVLVFNPLFPIRFEREVWRVLNIVAAVVIAGAGWALLGSRARSDVVGGG